MRQAGRYMPEYRAMRERYGFLELARNPEAAAQANRLMYEEPEGWSRPMGILVDRPARYLNGQIAAGADAVQIFDSWVGVLGPDDYRTFVLPYPLALIRALTPGTPVIHFGTGTA